MKANGIAHPSLLLLLVSVLLAFWPSQSEAAEPATFKDWTVACEQPGDGTQQRCAMFQRFVRAEDKAIAATVYIRYAGNSSVPLLRVVTPFGVDLARGVAVKVDDSEQYPVAFRTCRPAGCEAVAGIGNVLLDLLQAGRTLRVAYRLFDQGQQTVPFSLLGFTTALKALQAASNAGGQ
jgi:invasion protein IalB